LITSDANRLYAQVWAGSIYFSLLPHFEDKEIMMMFVFIFKSFQISYYQYFQRSSLFMKCLPSSLILSLAFFIYILKNNE